MDPLDRVSDCTDAAGAEDVEQPKLKRSTSIGQDLGTSPIRGLDPRMGYSGWNALKFDVGVGVACCAVMKLLPRLLKLPLINEAFVRRILYVMLGSRVAVLAMWDVARYQCRLISGRWKDDETLHGCGMAVITTGKWFRIMMFADLLMRCTMASAHIAPDMLVHHLGCACFQH